MSNIQSRYMYCSRMASDDVVNQVASIVKVAREFNASQGISGMLVFDGQHFCQYIEGPGEPLAELVGRIGRDPRHNRIRDLLPLGASEPRLFESWSMAYQIVDDSNGLERFFSLQGQEAVENLLRLIPELDRA